VLFAVALVVPFGGRQLQLQSQPLLHDVPAKQTIYSFGNQRVVIILQRSASEVFLSMIIDKISCTPSCSSGSVEVRKGVLAENQTALAKVQ